MSSDSIIVSPWPKIEIPHVSVPHFILQRLRFYGDKIFLIENDTGNSFTFNELANDSLRFAKILISNGLKDDDHFGICGFNNYEFIVTLFGGLIAGGVAVPISGNVTTEEITSLMHKRKIKFMTLGTRNHSSTAHNMLQKYRKGLKNIIAFGDDGDDNIKSEEYSSLRKHISLHSPQNEYHVGIVPMDFKTKNCMIIDSSGTVSNHACMITHYNLISSLTIASLPFTGLNWTDRDIVANSSSFSHFNGIIQLFVALTVGAKFILINQLKLKTLLLSIEKFKITSLMLTPNIILEMLKDDITIDYDLQSLKKVISTGAPLPKNIAPHFVSKFNIEDFRQSYGMTETIGFITMEPKGSEEYESSGVPMPLAQIKIVDTETGAELGSGQIGEIHVKSPQLFNGYFENIDKTLEMIDEKCWFHTGDIGYYDRNWRLQVVDPICDFIQYRGLHISPTALETILLSHDDVKECAIIGTLSKSDNGQCNGDNGQCDDVNLTAFVVPKCSNVTDEELTEYLNDHLIKQNMILSGGLYLIEHIPKNESGKVIRGRLRLIIEDTFKEFNCDSDGTK